MKTKVFIVLLLAFGLTSCSYLTKTGRQELAYRKYIRKSSVVRARQQKKFHFRVPQMAIRSDAPVMSAEPEGPQSVTASQAPSEQPPATAEQVASPN
jgi:hypothetical protein